MVLQTLLFRWLRSNELKIIVVSMQLQIIYNIFIHLYEYTMYQYLLIISELNVFLKFIIDVIKNIKIV
jgi:hypothetical protein